MRTKYLSTNPEDLKWLGWAKNQCSIHYGNSRPGKKRVVPAEGVLVTYGRDAVGMFVEVFNMGVLSHWYYATLPAPVTVVATPSIYDEHSGAGGHGPGIGNVGEFTHKRQLWSGNTLSQEWVVSGEVFSYLGSTHTTGVYPQPYPLYGNTYFTGQGIALYDSLYYTTIVDGRTVYTYTNFILSGASSNPTSNYGYTGDIFLQVVGHNSAFGNATYIHPSTPTPITTPYQTMYGDYLVAMSADSISRGITLAQIAPVALQTLVDGAHAGRMFTEAYVASAEAGLFAALRTTLTTTLSEAVRENHLKRTSVRWSPAPPTLTGDTSNGTSATISFTRDVVGQGEQTKIYECSHTISQQTIRQSYGPPAAWDYDESVYVLTNTTHTYVNWPEFQISGGVVSVPPSGQLNLLNGVVIDTQSPNPFVSSSTLVKTVMPEWRTWRDTHTPGSEEPPTTSEQWYDLCFANGEIIDVIPIYRVNSNIGDTGVYGPSIIYSGGVTSYWIRYVFKLRWDVETHMWEPVETREYTTTTGGRILIAASSKTSAAGWNTVGKAIIVSHKPLLPSMKTAYMEQEKDLTDITDPQYAADDPLTLVINALKTGKYINI